MSLAKILCVGFVFGLLCLGAPAVWAEDAEELDSLAISRDFLTLSRDVVVLADVPQPPQPEGKLQISPELGRILTDELVAQVQLAIPTAKVARLKDAPVESGGLVVTCHFSKLQPGSRAKRFWLGFGAGKSVLGVSGEVREGRAGRLVATFTHARASWCCGFGDNDREIRNNLVEVARDIAAIVAGRLAADQEFGELTEAAAPEAAPRNPPLPASVGTLAIDSNPAQADVEVDGKFVGSTPLELKLSAGDHTILVRKAGFTDWSHTLSVLADGKQNLVAELSSSADR